MTGSGVRMSLKRIAASIGMALMGCRVISAASSGVRMHSSMLRPARSARYSGM